MEDIWVMISYMKCYDCYESFSHLVGATIWVKIMDEQTAWWLY